MQEISTLPTSLKAMANVIEDTRRSLKEIESRVNNQDTGLEKLQAELERQLHIQERSSREIHKLKEELEKVSWKSQSNIKNVENEVPDALSASVPQNPASEGSESVKNTAAKLKRSVLQTNMPIMTGNGFSQITANFLKNLSKK
jgi:chromosome segregation ATPase